MEDMGDQAAQARADAQALLGERGWSRAEAASRIGMSETRLSRWMANKYRGDNARTAQLVARWLETEQDMWTARMVGLDRHADLAVTDQVERAASHAQANADIAVVFGAAGAGKTWALKHYCRARAGAWHVAMSPAVTTPASVLSRIARALGAGAGLVTTALLEQAVVDRLSGAGSSLLVVDEAHHLTQQLLDVVRWVHDQAACGLVLCGNEPLWGRLASGDRAAQIVSRVGLTYRLRRPAVADVVALAAMLMGAAPERKARGAVLTAASGMGGLRAVRKLISQAALLAAAEDRKDIAPGDIVDAAELLGDA